MGVIYIVLPLALLFAGAAVIVFMWAVRSGQFDDLDSAAYRAIQDEDGSPKTGKKGSRDQGVKG
ncbi:Cytochrome oxidase maturation protein cbb3-type [Phycisphaerae bacterium RAS1]|nr:Cytochrome oxidase maturation protein cbb3-type [Phycisphaerae bacterium RAS1]